MGSMLYGMTNVTRICGVVSTIYQSTQRDNTRLCGERLIDASRSAVSARIARLTRRDGLNQSLLCGRVAGGLIIPKHAAVGFQGRQNGIEVFFIGAPACH